MNARGLRRTGALALLATLALLAGGPALAQPAEEPASPASDSSSTPEPEAAAVGERFVYRWRLGNFLGVLAGLFLPNKGEGVLSFEPVGEELLRSELRITSEKAESGEYWHYHAEIDRPSGRTLRAGSSYFYNGKQKKRTVEIEEEGVVDIASAIHWLRSERPTRPQRREVWSDGKLYPVVIQPQGTAERKLGERKITAQRYVIEGIPGSAKKWKGKLVLWIAEDDRATPIEIIVERSGAAVHLKWMGP